MNAERSAHLPGPDSRPRPPWQLKTRRLELPLRPLVMGIINVTPDSFSDGGQFRRPSRGRRPSSATGRPTGRTCWTSAAKARARSPTRSTRARNCAASCPSCSRGRGDRSADLDRYLESRGGARGTGCRRRDHQRYYGAHRRSRDAARGARVTKAGPVRDAHARHAADHAARPALRRRRGRSARLSPRAARRT